MSRKISPVCPNGHERVLSGDIFEVNTVRENHVTSHGKRYTVTFCLDCQKEGLNPTGRDNKTARTTPKNRYTHVDTVTAEPWQRRAIEPVDPLRGVRRDDDCTESRVGCAAAMCVAVGA